MHPLLLSGQYQIKNLEDVIVYILYNMNLILVGTPPSQGTAKAAKSKFN